LRVDTLWRRARGGGTIATDEDDALTTPHRGSVAEPDRGSVGVGPRPPLLIEPTSGWASLHLGEVWAFRELLYFLTWRDIKVRYKQAVLGVAWAVLAPLFTIVVFTIVFNNLLGVKVPQQYPGVPYVIFSFIGLLPWNLFSGTVTKASGSLVSSSALLTKVYFPRLIIPASGILGGLPDFVISLAVLGGLMAWYHVAPTWNVIWLPAFIILTMATSFAISLWFSALNVLYRDVGYIIPFVIQLWMYLSPVAYPLDKVKGKLRFVFGLNPMSGAIQGCRWALLGGSPPGRLVFVAVAIVVIAFVSGLFYFKRVERTFADVV
jgi:lipopolysaccharide transport system permease protein